MLQHLSAPAVDADGWPAAAQPPQVAVSCSTLTINLLRGVEEPNHRAQQPAKQKINACIIIIIIISRWQNEISP